MSTQQQEDDKETRIEEGEISSSSSSLLPLEDHERQKKAERFQKFIDEKLKVELKSVIERRDAVYEKISNYLDLQRNIQVMRQVSTKNVKTQVNLGCEFYCQAVIPDASKICVDVGMGFFVEFTHDEALKFIAEKERHLNQVAEMLGQRAATISFHIRTVYEGIAELLGIPKEVDS